MTIRNLDGLFKPKSIALIGASDKSGSISEVLANNLYAAGYKGPVMPVNPRHGIIAGRKIFPDCGSLPEPADLGVICAPADAVPTIVSALAHQGARAAVVIRAGFGDRLETRVSELQQDLKKAAKPGHLRIVGPNCLGIMAPGIGLNASFAHRAPANGTLAFVAQSGAIVSSVLDWADARGIGFSASFIRYRK